MNVDLFLLLVMLVFEALFVCLICGSIKKWSVCFRMHSNVKK